ncbi:hypothetical protein HNP81_004641 [Peribacillus huizhouensis]|uniref:Uncharacterized protein n=1 Tax=Peribacillus huizhouensis TaxID=1501239 RepID=A0ABR6CW69_9BACI|nr:hypothetical protein [Peribacillus huizhouensis]
MEHSEVNVEFEKKSFYKKLFKGFIIVGLLFVAVVGYGVYWAFFDMKRLPTGEYLTEEKSTDGKYTLKAYVTNGGLHLLILFVVSWYLIEKEIKQKISIGIIDKILQILFGHTIIQW